MFRKRLQELADLVDRKMREVAGHVSTTDTAYEQTHGHQLPTSDLSEGITELSSFIRFN